VKGEILRRVPPGQREILGQVVRFGLTGGFVTLLYAAVYTLVANLPVPLPPNRHLQFGNLCGYGVAVAIGYLLHSRWSFRGHGRRDDVRRTTSRFFVVSLISLGLNAFWTWLLAAEFEWGRYTPLIPICFVTPVVTFTLNRRWVFG
jgi:putative flippase GtrA